MFLLLSLTFLYFKEATNPHPPGSRGIAGVLAAALLLVVLADLAQVLQSGGGQRPEGHPGADACGADPAIEYDKFEKEQRSSSSGSSSSMLIR